MGTDLKENGAEDKALFDRQLLTGLDFSESRGGYSPCITPQNPGENLFLRPLHYSDYDKGYMDLLKELTVVGEVTREQYEAQFDTMLACMGTYYVVVIEDLTQGAVIGSATLAVEKKFIHECSSRGRIEDVVVNNNYRGKQLGKLLLDVLVLLSQKVGCYKVSLECKDKVLPFYSLFGFVKEEGQNYMCRRF